MTFRRPLLIILAVVILLGSAVCSLLYKVDATRVQERLLTEAMTRNDLRAKQLAGSVAQLTVATVRLFDMALFQLRDSFIEDRSQLGQTANLVLKNLPPGSVNLFIVVDANGQIVFSSDHNSQGMNVGDRPYFHYFAENEADRLFISPPVQGRLGEKRWVIPIARAIRKGGKFQGVLVIGLLPEYLSAGFASLSLNPGDIVALIQNDGTFLARNHSLAEALGKKAPADRPFLDPARSEDETSRSVSSVDNVPVNFAWKRLPEWSLISVVALDERAELAPIRGAIEDSTRRSEIVIAAVMSSALVIAGLLVWAHRREHRLAGSETLLTAVMDSLPHNIAVLDDEGRIIQVNASWQDFARANGADQTLVEGVGINYLDIVASDPNDQYGLSALAGMRAVLEGRQEKYIQEYPCHSPTEDRWFELRVTPLRGIRPGLVTSHLDVTERKLDQQRVARLVTEQKAMLNNEMIGIVMVQNRTIVWANPAFEEILGYDSGELVGTSTRPLYVSEEAYLSFGAAAYQTLAEGRIYRTQIQQLKKDGRSIWVDVSGSTLDRDSGTTLWGFIDISDRKVLEFSLRETNAELEQFAYVASHDLRQPLRMVTSYLGLIEAQIGPQLSDDQKKYFAFATGGAKRMDRLITDLLDYSRTGRSTEMQEIPLAKAVADAVLNLTVEIREAKATVVVAEGMPTITGVPTDITRLFQNLIGNAIKYRSADRPPEVDIGWTTNVNGILIWVRDNGMGIAPENCERAFQIFQRLVPKEAYEGSGIGLAVCKKIVERHCGRIWIESEIGLGSTFFLTFPLSPKISDASA